MFYSTRLLRHLRLTVGQNIHRLREKKKMPLYKLAQATGISELKIDHYELGKGEIALDHMLKIACVLDVDLRDLLHNDCAP